LPHKLVIGKRSITSLTGKEQELIEELKKIFPGCMGVGRIFSRGGAKVGIFGFNPSKLKKQPVLANNFKIRGGKALPFDAHAGMLLESHLLSVMVLALELNGWWKLFHSGH